jgi:hypothetical protein
MSPLGRRSTALHVVTRTGVPCWHVVETREGDTIDTKGCPWNLDAVHEKVLPAAADRTWQLDSTPGSTTPSRVS